MSAPDGEVVVLRGLPCLPLALLLFAGGASAGVNQWTPSGPSAKVTSLTIDASGTLYALTRAGIYNSRDGGTSWALINTALTSFNTRALAGDTLFGGTVRAIGCSGALESDNFGMDWSLIRPGLPADCSLATLDSNPRRPGTLFVSGPAGLYRTDYGSDWRALGQQMFHGPVVLGVVPADQFDPFQLNLYAAPEGGGFFYSGDGGTGWASTPGGPPGARILAISPDQGKILAGTNQGLYQTPDSGNSWTEADPALAGVPIYSLLSLPSVTYAGTEIGVFRHLNEPWEHFSAGLSSGDSLSNVIADSGGRTLWAVPSSGDGTVVYTYGNPNIHVSPARAAVIVGEVVSFDLTLDPLQPEATPLSVRSSDDSSTYTEDEVAPAFGTQSLFVGGRHASFSPATVTVSVPESLGGAKATVTVDVRNPVPAFRMLDPSLVIAGSGSLTLRVYDLAPWGPVTFADGATVYWNGSPRPTRPGADGACPPELCFDWLDADISAADVASPSKAVITVVNPPGGGTSASRVLFIVPPDTARGSIERVPRLPPATRVKPPRD